MKSYKVEFTVTNSYVFDARANDEEEAKEIADKQFLEADNAGTLHYSESGSDTSITVFDVTDTDDDPNLAE
jgi:hypothetical protein